MTGFITRFAPSPTGRLHLGHAASALAAAAAADAAGGRLLLRVEDIDATRCRPAFVSAIEEDLAWLGLVWERPVRRQSEHMADYAAARDRLRARGCLYRCFKTRREVLETMAAAPHDDDRPDANAFVGGPLPPREEAQRLAAGAPFAWRLSLAAARATLGAAFDTLSFVEEGVGPGGERGVIAARPQAQGDVVLARRDVGVAYHLAVVVDDALQGVTHVVRGCDLFAATHTHRLLQALLDLPTPTYRHHPLLLGTDGARLAKRDGAPTIAALRAEGRTPEQVRAMVHFADPAPERGLRDQ